MKCQTNPAQFILPLHFRQQPPPELESLIGKDSVFGSVYNKLGLVSIQAQVKYFKTVLALVKAQIHTNMENLQRRPEKFQRTLDILLAQPEPFDRYIDAEFSAYLNSIDQAILKELVSYYALLEEQKRLTRIKIEQTRIGLALKTDIEKFAYRFEQFAALVKFESQRNIHIRKLNKLEGEFKDLHQMVDVKCKNQYFDCTDFSGLTLVEAFHVQNSHLESDFERGLNTVKSPASVDVYISVRKKQVIPIVTFGLKSKKFVLNDSVRIYSQKVLKVPEPTRTEGFFKASKGINSKIRASVNTTLSKDVARYASDTVFFLIKARMVMSMGRCDIDIATEEARIGPNDILLPSHVLICTLEKSIFPTQPVGHLVLDFNLNLPPRNCRIDAATFFDDIDKALSQIEAKKLAIRKKVQENIEEIRNTIVLSIPISIGTDQVLSRLKMEVDRLTHKKDLT